MEKTMYTLKHTKSVEVEVEEAGNLVAQVLQEDYEFVSASINELKFKSNIRPHEAEDLARDLEIRNAMKTLLSYYMVKSEYDKFMEIQRCYGND
jgi:hypothetical protein